MVNLPLGNLKKLRNDMLKQDRIIEVFDFSYNGNQYLVLVKRYLGGQKKPNYALVNLDFILRRNFSKHLEVNANSSSLDIDWPTFAGFFNIKVQGGYADVFQSFYEMLGKNIPTEIRANYSNQQKQVMGMSLNRSDSEDPNKLYCYMVKKNSVTKSGKQKLRTVFNSEKTKIFRPELYAKLKDEPQFSFYYSPNKDAEKSNIEILRNLAKNN